jgi:hypothetical protein
MVLTEQFAVSKFIYLFNVHSTINMFFVGVIFVNT